MLQAKLSLAMPVFQFGVLVQALAALPLMSLPANAAGKAVEDVSSAWVLIATWRCG